MAVESQPYADLLAEAAEGKLQLPEFQRNWKWSSKDVIRLFDSVRQGIPIGSFLFMERNHSVPITPRPFFMGTDQEIGPVSNGAFILDGQQRLTAGLILFYGRGKRRYFLDLEFLYSKFEEEHGAALAAINADELSPETAEARTAFLVDLDAEDGYCTSRPGSRDPRTLLLSNHLLETALLRDSDRLEIELSVYKREHASRAKFVDYVVKNSFLLKRDLIVPVTVVERDRPVESICRIFSTINTTGRRLTPFELVISLLYPFGIRLRDEVEAMIDRSVFFRNMDSTGEVLLQTIALIHGQDPKKSKLPETITADRFRRSADDAFKALEKLGRFLSARLGVGLERSASFTPYDSIFAPMALALEDLESRNLSPANRAKAEFKLERWFVLSALDRRYQEGVHNKQKAEPREFREWALEGDEEPDWIKAFRAPSLRGDSAAGARPALLKCLINQNAPKDLLSGVLIGYRETAEAPAVHHFFPIGYCRTTLGVEKSDVALNLLLTTVETNAVWSMSNPHDQLSQAIAARGEHFVREELQKQFVNDEAFTLLRKPDKEANDFNLFLELREKAVMEALRKWQVEPGASCEIDDAEDEA